LYGDITSLVHEAISHFSNEIENYSINEAFAVVETNRGRPPPINFEIKLKMLFLQYTFNLSDEEVEDQLIDRLGFQQFVGTMPKRIK